MLDDFESEMVASGDLAEGWFENEFKPIAKKVMYHLFRLN